MPSRIIRAGVAVAVLAVAGAGASLAASAAMRTNATVRTATNAMFGTVLVGPNGRTLYRFTRDRKHVNNCTKVAICAKNWPRLLVKTTAKPTVAGGARKSLVGTIAQRGGVSQVTYAGWPLYYFAGDEKRGEVNGQGFQKEWYVVNTKGALVKHATAKASPPTPPAPTTTGAATGGGGYGGGGGGGDAWG